MDLIDRALRVIRLREAGPYSTAAIRAAECQRVGTDMLRCMAGYADDESVLAKMQKSYNAWMGAVDMVRKEIGTDEDTTQPYLYEANTKEGNLGSIIRLEERAVRTDGTVPVKIIKPGWGTTGYYGEKVLEKYGPQGFPAGTKMFWDHPTETEARERPERSLKDLAAELVTDAKYDPSGVDGPGLYSHAKVFEAYKGPVDELAAHIGTSIRAFGAAAEGEAEGRKGQIIESIIPSVMNSIDFVTLPGAGGQIVSLFEAARGRHTDADPNTSLKEAIVGDQNKETPQPTPPTPPTPTPPSEPTPGLTAAITEAVRLAVDPISTQLKESQAETARLREGLLLRDARDIVKTALDKFQSLPDMTKARLQESLSMNPPTKEGVLDTEAFSTKIQEAVTSELNYLSQVTGRPIVTGIGGSDGPAGGQTTTLEEAQKGLGTALGRLGLTEKEASTAASGRAN